MPRIECEGTIVAHIIADTERQAAEKFRAKYRTAPHSAGTKDVVGGCETCPTVILDGDEYRTDGEGCYWCMPCFGDGTDIEVGDCEIREGTRNNE